MVAGLVTHEKRPGCGALCEALLGLSLVLHIERRVCGAGYQALTVPSHVRPEELGIFGARCENTARQLCAYAGLTPSVQQSANSSVTGRITKEGSKQLRRALTQAGHVLLFRCQSESSAPLKAKPARIAVHRARRKIAVVAAARHILRTAFYVLRDQTTTTQLY